MGKIAPVATGDKEVRLSAREKIESLESSMKRVTGTERGDMDGINKEGLSEYLIGGAYTRILRIPEDTAMTTKLWKVPRLWILIEGSVNIFTEEGEQTLVAPYVGEAPFGTKVALHTVTDCLWAAITGSGSEDSGEVEAELITNNYEDIAYEWEQVEK